MQNQKIYLSEPNYRPDIDGLRAISVLAVVGFHAAPGLISGGFIGVDIFFVISGYLISKIIFESLDKGTFSFSEFYSRRIRRIFPALIFVLACCFAVGWLVLLEDEYKQLLKHISAGTVFISNFIFWNEAGYFDNDSDTKPLLHLWSLAIEEQYYIAWPLLLWFAWKRKFNILKITLVIAVFSIIFNIRGVNQDAIGTFYSPIARFWELLSGSLLAWITLYKRDAFANTVAHLNTILSRIIFNGNACCTSIALTNALSLAGFFLLLCGFFLINKEKSFPGYWGLVPVIGTLLLLISDSKAWFNRMVLSNKLLVWFGLISFPLYLWHYPALSFARIVSSEVPSREVRVLAVALSVLLAWLTYKFIERPIRFGKNGKVKTVILAMLMVTIGGASFKCWLNILEAERYNPRERLNAEAIENCRYYFPQWIGYAGAGHACRMQKREGNTIAIIGDSHAGHLYIGVSELMSKNEGVVVFDASCAAPFVNIASSTKVADPHLQKTREEYYKLINSAYDFVINSESIKTVILAHDPACSFGDIKDISNINNNNKDSILRDGVERSVDLLVKADKKVLILFDNPRLPYDPKKCAHRPFKIAKVSKDYCLFSRKIFDSEPYYSWYKSVINLAIKNYSGVSAYDLSTPLCDEENCYLTKNGKLLYKDTNHLNYEGSRYVASYIIQATKNIK
jgi:peptidoglycan/LPS O-acetylase OafA/YrhL